MDDGVVFPALFTEEIDIVRHIERGGEAAFALLDTRIDFVRHGIHAVAADFIAHRDTEGQLDDLIGLQQLRTEVAGAVCGDLYLHSGTLLFEVTIS